MLVYTGQEMNICKDLMIQVLLFMKHSDVKKVFPMTKLYKKVIRDFMWICDNHDWNEPTLYKSASHFLSTEYEICDRMLTKPAQKIHKKHQEWLNIEDTEETYREIVAGDEEEAFEDILYDFERLN